MGLRYNFWPKMDQGASATAEGGNLGLECNEAVGISECRIDTSIFVTIVNISD